MSEKTRLILFVCWKIELSYRTKTCQNAALYTAGVCSDETAACLFLVFDKSVALHLVEIIESDTQSLPGFEFSIDFFLWNRKFPWLMWSRKAPFWNLPRQLDISFCCYKSFEGQLSSVCKKKKIEKDKNCRSCWKNAHNSEKKPVKIIPHNESNFPMLRKILNQFSTNYQKVGDTVVIR